MGRIYEWAAPGGEFLKIRFHVFYSDLFEFLIFLNLSVRHKAWQQDSSPCRLQHAMQLFFESPTWYFSSCICSFQAENQALMVMLNSWCLGRLSQLGTIQILLCNKALPNKDDTCAAWWGKIQGAWWMEMESMHFESWAKSITGSW